MDLLRFVVAGSVDDGKSTLLSRLLHDAGALDGHHIEIEQGGTIDVAYRYFATARRRFIAIDAPGHEQYTRYMATGASNARLALLLVDAKLGLRTQTRRHAFICSLLGIPRLVIALNKMDLVGHSQARFDQLCEEFERFAARLGFKSLSFIPVSALNGDNVVLPGNSMPWYSGPTILQQLESIYVGGDRNLVDLRFAVQRVARDADTRWYCGQLGSGVISVGDEVVALPSHRRTRVRAIAVHERSLATAFAPQSVAVALEDDLELGRGAILAHPRNVPKGVRELDAMVVWMQDEPLQAGKLYVLKHGPSWVRASCTDVAYRIDLDTLHRSGERTLALNDIGRARFTLFEERFVDAYARNRSNGAFILVDPGSNATAGAGMVVDREIGRGRVARGEAAKRLALPTAGKVAASERCALMGQRPVTVWLTGLSGAGKSTLAAELERRLVDAARPCYVLDGDNLRAGINRDLGFGPEDRRENIRRIAEIARLMNDAGLVAVSAFISPYRADREMARQIVGADRFIEVHVDAPLEVCERRDPKGLYRKARRGELPDFTGVTAPYEAPENPEMVLATALRPVEECVRELLALVSAKILVSSPPCA